MRETPRTCHRPVTQRRLPRREAVTRLPVKEVDMSILLAGLLLSAWGLLVFSAPRRKRYRRWRAIGDSSIAGEENDIGGSSINGEENDITSAVGGAGDCGDGGDVGGSDCGGGGDFGGSDGGGCGGGGD
jgi:hypothetical protein